MHLPHGSLNLCLELRHLNLLVLWSTQHVGKASKGRVLEVQVPCNLLCCILTLQGIAFTPSALPITVYTACNTSLR